MITVYEHPSKFLTTVSTPFDFATDRIPMYKDLEKFERDMIGCMKSERGLGLSANQIGLDVRACVINVKEPLVLINPRVTEVSKETVAYVEQCLSLDKTMRKPVKTVRRKSSMYFFPS